MSELQIRKFIHDDFSEYLSWFTDPELNRYLGPMEEDDEWLDVLNQPDAIEYSVFRGQELVAVLGIKLPKDEYPDYYITDIAVRPDLKGQGIGSTALQHLFALHPLKPGQLWRAFVHIENPKARIFLEKNKWVCESDTPSEHGMLAFMRPEL